MNFSKTNMYNKQVEDKDTTIKIEKAGLKKVDHYIYLVQRITMESSQEEERKRRITLR